jgi:hypothetical protein
MEIVMHQLLKLYEEIYGHPLPNVNYPIHIPCAIEWLNGRAFK